MLTPSYKSPTLTARIELLSAAALVLLAFSGAPSFQEGETFEDKYKETAEDQASRRELFPMIEPYQTGSLKVSAIHEIYFEECGNPQGKPVVVLHGGPGGGGMKSLRRFFDPTSYRIIIFDQRGAGRSTPRGCLDENTTWLSVADMEKLREHLGIDKWMVSGGSWGSTLALAYAETHPSKVTELILRGIFMLRRSELEFFYQEGASHIFPDAWENFESLIPPAERSDMMSAYRKRLTSEDPGVRLPACKEWTVWEFKTSCLRVNPGLISVADDAEFAEPFARIENHYFVNGGFFPTETYLLDNVEKIRHIPCVIVQGRYDLVCPMKSAWDLHKVWPEAKFVVVPDAGHSSGEPGIVSELIKASEAFKS